MSGFLCVAFLVAICYSWPYYVLYVQTDEGLDVEARLRRAKSRQMLYLWLNQMHQTYRIRNRPLRLPKQDRIDAERLRRYNENVRSIQEWRLASDEELKTFEPRQLQFKLDSRNINCDTIIQLLAEMDDPVMRASKREEWSRQSALMERICELRLQPLRDAEDAIQQRVELILRKL